MDGAVRHVMPTRTPGGSSGRRPGREDTNASADLSYVMRRMAEHARAGDTTRKAEDSALAAERERALYAAIKEFRLSARAAIGQTV
ncbi:hypothetical protein ACFWM7_06385 [Streptomyces sp. NPDC058375]|uniref:hypothetical protein n=1 Tax=Streptomyces sp. NPDC058375 TaxID=3346467 RepID=UPI00364DE786